MYIGEIPVAVDEKGRMMVPQDFRATMDKEKHGNWCATRGFEGYVLLFHEASWAKILNDHASVFEGFGSKGSLLRRLFVGGMERVTRDAQGRLSIPPHLREHAGIERDSVLIGVGEHMELWSKRVWREYRERQAEVYTKLADELLADSAPVVTTEGECADHVDN